VASRRITIFRETGFEIGEISEETQTGDQAVEEAIDTSLSLEADLEAALVANLSQLEQGLRLYQDGARRGQQLDAQSRWPPIDILAIDANEEFVVIRPQGRRRGSTGMWPDSRTYMGVGERELGWSRTVRGILSRNMKFQRNESRGLSVAGGPRLKRLKKYRVNFSFTNG